MNAAEFNRREIEAGRLTAAHLLKLLGDDPIEMAVRQWQSSHNLVLDGKAGSQTQASLDVESPAERCWPLRCLIDGRRPKPSANIYNPGIHDGIDLFYEWRDADPDPGDGVTRHGHRLWFFPLTPPRSRTVIAAAAGRVLWAYPHRNGWRVKLDHGNGWTTLYLHLAQGCVMKGDKVEMGQDLAYDLADASVVNPPHLHFETRLKGVPQPPLGWLGGAAYLPAIPLPVS